MLCQISIWDASHKNKHFILIIVFLYKNENKINFFYYLKTKTKIKQEKVIDEFPADLKKLYKLGSYHNHKSNIFSKKCKRKQYLSCLSFHPRIYYERNVGSS